MAKLAVRGGSRVIPSDMPMFRTWPVVDEEVRSAVLGVLDRGLGVWGSNAPEAEGLAKEWAEYVGVAHCLVTNSGTSAIHMGVRGVGVRAGDEVIVPAYCYGAAPATVFHQSAVPVFVDVDPDTFMLDAAKIEERITERTRAIMPVHIFGLTADMDAIQSVADRHGLGIVSDAAQAAGSAYKGRKAGALEDAAGFSLNPTKNLPGIEGGLFVANDPEVFENGTMASQNIHLVGDKREYPVYSLGFGYRPNEMSSAVARCQLRRLDEHNAMRQTNAERLSSRLAQLPGVKPPHVPPECEHSYHMYRVGFEPSDVGVEVENPTFRDKVRDALVAEGVPCGQWIDGGSGPTYPLFQLREGYGGGVPWKWHDRHVAYDMDEFPVTKRFMDSTTELASAPLAQSEQVIDLIADAFDKVWANMDEVLR